MRYLKGLQSSTLSKGEEFYSLSPKSVRAIQNLGLGELFFKAFIRSATFKVRLYFRNLYQDQSLKFLCKIMSLEEIENALKYIFLHLISIGSCMKKIRIQYFTLFWVQYFQDYKTFIGNRTFMHLCTHLFNHFPISFSCFKDFLTWNIFFSYNLPLSNSQRIRQSFILIHNLLIQE